MTLIVWVWFAIKLNINIKEFKLDRSPKLCCRIITYKSDPSCV